MLINKFYKTREDGVKLYRVFSDSAKMIRKIGTEEIYSEAIDVENSAYTYTETNIPIEEDTGNETEQKAAAFDYLTGRTANREA